MSGSGKPRILCVSPSPSQHARIHWALSRKYEPLVASSPEQAVAFCVSHAVAAIILDAEFYTWQGWSVAQTFKSINPLLPVLLLHENLADPLPPGVDAVVTPTLIGEKLELLLAQAP
jgi:PleD family two-component response regulator